MSPGVSTQAVLLKLPNISAVAQALGETPTDGVSVTSGRTSLGELRRLLRVWYRDDCLLGSRR
jgi:hypothetical protein